ncbi:MAG TPA: trypsin-like peptidase domain-containing protein [Candidatus Atopostipes pullistercoris]|uniref:Trypsin-like peptidase domain-containing protein n=1 Tax=Candidatus Atopostipes pullistercoris TaxID=2838467 RepID=A0A9D2JYF5_9LACT|nr:trypsin-like peptidase domain-containing protein [Candidatus Atopostipes pullistercoris]
MKNKMKRALMLSAIPLVLLGCTNGVDDSDTPDNETEDQETVKEEVKISNVEVNVQSGITEAVEQIDDAVVSIINLQRNDFSSWAGFYGMESASEDEYLQAGSGSGAVYKIEDDQAYIFTNNHVVEGSDAIQVLLQDGTRVDAEVEGTDVWTDLAVLSVDASNVETVVEFGDSENLTVGEPAIAIGSPLGTDFASSVTSGIISGIGRTVPVDTDGDGEYDWEMTAIQTDAAINPGNSGGPLINIAGQVVGINSMKISTETVEGMGFAIPSNDAVDIINQLEQNGEVVRPYLGITMIDLAYISDSQRADELNLPDDVTDGVVITRVGNDSAATNAGLEPADVIVGFNGEKITNSVHLRQLIYSAEVGDSVEIEFYRNGEPRVVTMEMQAADND